MPASSWYNSANCHLTIDSIMSITRYNVLSALFKTNGTLKNLYSFQHEIYVVLSFTHSSISICKFPDVPSNIEDMRASHIECKHSPFVRLDRHP